MSSLTPSEFFSYAYLGVYALIIVTLILIVGYILYTSGVGRRTD